MLAKWHESLSQYGNLFSADSISGSTPPSVFVGSFNYPKVFAGPMVPPIHGDTSLFDSPEMWKGKTLEEIVNFRLNLVRGTRAVPVNQTDGRYIESLQEVAMSSRPADSELTFERAPSKIISLDGYSAPSGPAAPVKTVKFSDTPSLRAVEKAFYDRDMSAQDAVMSLYNSGVDMSRIQRCFSIGMLGQKRRLVPTRWSITATDDIVSKSLVCEILDYSVIDSCQVFSYSHLGNVFCIVLFPHRWVYEMIEAWYSGGILGFGSDSEDARGIDHKPAIAGAYHAARLAVAEYLARIKLQAGVIILREIRPEYAIPVGVWQIREGIREAMRQKPVIPDNFEDALNMASSKTSISKSEWLSHGRILKMLRQKSISDFF
ncbi:MAG: hypothetical protein EB828_01785 [Nitrosopumilus sp. D6]|nr:MAG: hypothetical protein EB828_01785 [Nitrosopumilus sp. D6]